ncbi:MAG: type II secretion system F family protein [Acidobacteria bacterium]|nr:MAG: type II secretion system F family protein [Acidobacteriota bacterium]
MATTTMTLTIFAGVALVMFGLGAAWMARGNASDRLREMLGDEPAEKPKMAERMRVTLEKAMNPAARLLPPSAKEASKTRRWLIQAGYREPRHARFYFGLRALCVLAALAAVFAFDLESRSPLMLVAAPLAGLILPRFVLKRRMKARAKRIRLALPDALDLLVICVEAGLGLDQAMVRVSSELKGTHPDLCSELELLGLETRAGVPRVEALRHLAERSGVDDLRALAAVLIQTERFGTSIAQALRVHSDALRTERRQRAEEAAAKLSIKMLPVLALFVFPAVMVVILGPAAISLIRHLGPLLAH